MKKKYQQSFHFSCCTICIIILCLGACAKIPKKKPIDKAILQAPVPVEEKKSPEQLKISIVDILSAEAEKFFLQGNYKDALFVYSQALSQAGEDQKPSLISKVESVLAKTPTQVLAEVIDLKNMFIPRPLLLYWLGVNYALENNAAKSKQVLETFLSQYPDHYYHSDAADLLDVIRKSLFNRGTIGCLLPLTGKYAVFGQRALSGVQLAIQALSKKYSKEFNVIIIDTQADPDKAVEGVRQLHQKNVAGIMGPLLPVIEAGQEAEKLHIPMIALTQKSDFPRQGDYLFANFITPEMQVQTLGAYLFKTLGIKTVAILYPDEKYGKKYMELFWDMVDEYNGEVVGVESYDGKETDFTEPIQKLTGQYFPVPGFLKTKAIELENTAEQNQDPKGDLEPADTETEIPVSGKTKEKIQIDFQALFIPDSPSNINLILPQLAYNDATGMYLIGTNLWHNESLLKDTMGYNSHAVITDGFFDGSRNAVTAEFTKRYESMFNIKPQFLEAISYDTASILFLAAMDETIDSRETLKDALQGNRIFEGVTGTTIFDKYGSAHRELFLMTIQKGKFIEISR